MVLQAYTTAFTSEDNVALIVHAAYGDDYWKWDLLEAEQDRAGPAVLFLEVRLAVTGVPVNPDHKDMNRT